MSAGAGRVAAVAALAALVLVPAAGAAPAIESPDSQSPPGAQPGRRGIVLMTVDSLRPDRLGCYTGGKARTPGMDALARAGIRFERAYTASVSTAPSVASLMTGLDPPGHGLRRDVQGRLDAGVPTLAERLRASGWATAAVIGTDRLASARGLARGFERYDDDIVGIPKRVLFKSKERRASDVAERGLMALDALPGDRPFFLWLHFHDPHFDYDPPEAQKKERPDSPYDAEVAAVDDAVDALVRAIKGRMPGGRLTFVLAGTHGEGLGDQKEVGHGFYLHEATVRVPLLIAPEAAVAAAGGTQPAVAGLVDIAPTLLAIAGVPPPAPIDGRVLAAVATAPAGNEAATSRSRRGRAADGPRRVYMEAPAPYFEYGWSPLAGIVEGDRKVVVAPGGRVEAFDLAADPAGSAALPKAPRWAVALAREAAARLGTLDPPEERRREVATASAGFEFPWGNSPFCAEKVAFPDPRDPDRVALSARLYPARFDSDLGLPGFAGQVALEVVDQDPANLSVLEFIAVFGLRKRWGDMLLDRLEILTCNYPYRVEGYHYLGHHFTQEGDLRRALELFRIMTVVDPESAEAEYDIACTLAALGEKDDAFEHLRRAIDLGARDFDFMRRDGRMAPLRADPRFDELVPKAGR